MKGHSERLPKKNLKDFNGQPLFYWVLSSLMAVPQIAEIIVDTDSDEIATQVKTYCESARIVKRPAALQGDAVPMNRIIEHDLSVARYEHILQTHSTNPLLSAKTIDIGLSDYFMHLYDYDSLFSVTRLQTRLYSADGSAINHDPNVLLRTQDLPPVYEENSCFYLFSKTSFADSGRRIGRRPRMFVLERDEAMDIDEPHDFEMARIMQQIRSTA